MLRSKGTCAALVVLVSMLVSMMALLASPAWSQEGASQDASQYVQSDARAGEQYGDAIRGSQQAGEGSVSDSEQTPAEEVQRDEVPSQNDLLTKEQKQNKNNTAQRQSPLDGTRRGTEEVAADDQVQPQATDEDPIDGDAVKTERDGDDITQATIDIDPGLENCTVAEDATITFLDNDGSTGQAVNGENAVIELVADQVVVSSPDGGPIVFDPGVDGTEPGFQGGLVVEESTGITCETSEGGGTEEGGNCAVLENEEDGTEARFEGVAAVVGTIVPQTDTTGEYTLRVVYATSSEDGTLDIVITDETGEDVVNETVEGAQADVVEATLNAEESYDFEITPTDQGFAAVLEEQLDDGVEGEECTDPESLEPAEAPSNGDEDGDGTPDNVDDDNDNDGDLPDTGGDSGTGLPVGMLAPVVGLGLVGLVLTGAGFLRRRVMDQG